MPSCDIFKDRQWKGFAVFLRSVECCLLFVELSRPLWTVISLNYTFRSTVWLILLNSAIATKLPEPFLTCIPVCVHAHSLIWFRKLSHLLFFLAKSFDPSAPCNFILGAGADSPDLCYFPLLRSPVAFAQTWCGLTSHPLLTVCVYYILCLDIFTILLKVLLSSLSFYPHICYKQYHIRHLSNLFWG